MNPENSPTITPKKTNFLSLMLVVITILSLALSAFLYYRLKEVTVKNSYQTDLNITPPQQVQFRRLEPSENSESAQSSNDQKYRLATYGAFSYEYPRDWHVAELWPTDSSGEITLAMDPNPISTSPKDSPPGIFTFILINGRPNPDEIFQQKIGEFNEEIYNDITHEVLQSDLGEINYFKGLSRGPYAEGEPVEQYIFSYNLNPDDPLNQTVVVATLLFNHDPKISEMLKHVVLSFKKVN